MASAKRNSGKREFCFFLGLHLILVLSSIFILKELALARFFNSITGKIITVLLSVGILGYLLYRIYIERRKKILSNRSYINVESSEDKISGRRFYIVLILLIGVLILSVALLAAIVYAYIWIINYGLTHQYIANYSEVIFMSICAFSVFALIPLFLKSLSRRIISRSNTQRRREYK